jgi:predicted outer membrane repeat protein
LFKGRFLAAIVIFLASFYTSGGRAAILEVPQQYPTIAAALESAQSGDVVHIASGRYYEYGLKLPAGITLQGTTSETGDTIIDAMGRGRILTARFLDSAAFIQDLTFANGWAQEAQGYEHCGGALYINDATLRVRNCKFINNRAEADGGAISCMNSSSLFINCQFLENSAGEGGGAIDCSYRSSPLIQDCLFRDNSAAYGGALASRASSRPKLTGAIFDRNSTSGEISKGGGLVSFFEGELTLTLCTLSRNSARIGGGIYSADHCPIDISECTIVANEGTEMAGGIFTTNSSALVTNSIIAFQTGAGIVSGGGTLPTISCTDIYGNSGGDWAGNLASQAGTSGNLNTDPEICLGDLDDRYQFNLEDGSPCSLDGGACADLGAWPVGCPAPLETVLSLGQFLVEWNSGSPVITWNLLSSPGDAAFRLVRVQGDLTTEEEIEIPYTLGQSGQFSALDSFLPGGSDQPYRYRLYQVMGSGALIELGSVTISSPPPVMDMGDVAAWPNPFNPCTSIHFTLGSSQEVGIEIYSLAGRRVRTLARQVFDAGPRNVEWNGLDDSGQLVASGTYFVIVRGERQTQRLKVTLLK